MLKLTKTYLLIHQKTLQEALQSIWTVESLFEVEENQTGLSLGRLDQYCFPMYENDIKSGRLTRRTSTEMMQAFIIKCAELMGCRVS